LDFIEGGDLPRDHLPVLLKFSSGLFLTPNLPHNIILQKPLIKKMQEYYEIKEKSNLKLEPASDKMMRRACNKICSSLLCIYNDEFGLINEMYRYGMSIKDILHEIIDATFIKDL